MHEICRVKRYAEDKGEKKKLKTKAPKHRYLPVSEYLQIVQVSSDYWLRVWDHMLMWWSSTKVWFLPNNNFYFSIFITLYINQINHFFFFSFLIAPQVSTLFCISFNSKECVTRLYNVQWLDITVFLFLIKPASLQQWTEWRSKGLD